jgi:hypothetical protein
LRALAAASRNPLSIRHAEVAVDTDPDWWVGRSRTNLASQQIAQGPGWGASATTPMWPFSLHMAAILSRQGQKMNRLRIFAGDNLSSGSRRGHLPDEKRRAASSSSGQEGGRASTRRIPGRYHILAEGMRHFGEILLSLQKQHHQQVKPGTAPATTSPLALAASRAVRTGMAAGIRYSTPPQGLDHSKVHRQPPASESGPSLV